jgi:hypothetical protein
LKLAVAFKKRCEGIAIAQRERVGLRAYDPLPALIMVGVFKARLVTPYTYADEMLPEQVAHLLSYDDWSAGIISKKPLIILYDPRHSSARFESDLMHEFGHVLLDHPMIQFDSSTGLPLREQRYEDEATYLGSCLQIPKRGLAWAIGRNCSSEQIASYFGCSEEIVAFRCNMTGLQLPSIEK